MQLFCSAASPYVRKVRMCALEKRLPLTLVEVASLDSPPELLAANPSSKIPALITDDGLAIAESHHICTYLEYIQPEPILFPKDATLPVVLHRDALCIAIMDATVKCVQESRRPENYQYPVWIERQHNAIKRSLAVLETEADSLGEAFTIDQISLFTALDYLKLRLPELTWEKHHPKLAAWFNRHMDRPSVRETSPLTA